MRVRFWGTRGSIPVALTAAFMADRYHTLREIKRQVGPLRQAGVSETPTAA